MGAILGPVKAASPTDRAAESPQERRSHGPSSVANVSITDVESPHKVHRPMDARTTGH